jgi:type VI secretion system secreted protein VgrG
MSTGSTVGDATLPEVAFRFSGAGSATWSIVHGRVSESLSALYEATLDVATPELDANPDDLVGQPASLLLQRGDLQRFVQGLVRRVDDLGTSARHRLARVYLVPGAWVLSQRVNSKIFQEKNAVEVVQAVWEAAGLPVDALDVSGVTRTPSPREYCVQYRETDLAFIQRLLEEEGISYAFEHDANRETMALFHELPVRPEVQTLAGTSAPVAGPEDHTAAVETVRRFDWHRQLRPTGTTLRDYDFTRPSATMDMTRAKPQPPGAREVYDYPARLNLHRYDEGDFKYHAHDGRALSEVRRQSQEALERTGHALTNVTGALPGRRLTVEGAGRSELNDAWLITRVEHVFHQPELLAGDHGVTVEDVYDRYHNTLSAVLASAPWRPQRTTPRPVVQGPQTAVVIGPAGEEIYTDHHGRIKAQFHWDRDGQMNERSSCWIRVAQVWAAAGWGAVYTPRIGMEVVVQFLDGDPDRPLVTGAVYNGTNGTPYPLPDDKTISTLKSNSSPGGNGSNELRFQDLAGSEEIYLHAQKDFNEVVEHDHTTTVHNNQTNTVDCNQTESVGGNQSMTVTGDRTHHVKKNETITVDKNQTIHIRGTQSVTVDGEGGPFPGATLTVKKDYKVDATATVAIQAPTSITLTCGGSTLTMTPNQIVLHAGGGATLTLNSDATMVGSTSTVHGSAHVAINGPDIQVVGDTVGIGNKDITISGTNVGIGGSTKVVADGAGATLELKGTAGLNGTTTNVGGGTLNLSGNPINVN